MGRFITRLRPGDRQLQDQIYAEALRCHRESIPTSQAVDQLVALAGDNPRAFDRVGGAASQGSLRTDEGQAVLTLIAAASKARTTREHGVGHLSRHRRSPEESALSSLPLAEAFDRLSAEEPRLRMAEVEVGRVAADARRDGQDDAGVRSAVDGIVKRVVLVDHVVGKSTLDPKGLCSTRTGLLVVVEHLYQVAGISAEDIDRHVSPPKR